MANVTCRISFDREGFEAELLHRLALTSGTEENYERIASEIYGDFVLINGHPMKPDILDAEFLEDPAGS